MEKTPAERFKEANEKMSEHCFKVGRLRYDIELDEESLEKKKLEYRNMRVDFDRLRKEFSSAFEAMQSANKTTKEAAPRLELQQ